MTEYDAIVIGTGQSGPALAHRLTGAGMRVAIVERHRFGGTCINTGCTPTKTLVASAYAAHLARRAAEFGVMVGGPVTVDMKKVKERKDYVSGLSARGVERSLRDNPKCTVYQGHARFVSSREVSVGGEMLTALAHLHQCRRARFHSGHTRARPGRLFHQQHDAGCGLRAPASRHHRRKLHRLGARADLPPLRQPR